MRTAAAVAILLSAMSVGAQARNCHSDPVSAQVVTADYVRLPELRCSSSLSNNQATELTFVSGRLHELFMRVYLKNENDAARMVPGAMVRIRGDFLLEKQGAHQKVFVHNAEILP